MQQSDALKRLLTDHTRLYAGDRVPVRFSQQPHYAGPKHGGPYLAVNPDVRGWYNVNVNGANELRLLRDTLSHEAYEYRMGHPSAKEAFMRRHGAMNGGIASPKAKAAGNLYNILRDAWVNTTRCRDFPGLRRTFAFKADLLAGDDDVSQLPPADALLAGLHQISLTNTATGVANADPEVRRLLATARHYVERCRTAGSHEELAALADGLFAKFEPVFDAAGPDLEDMADHLDDLHPDARVEDMTDDQLADAIDDAVQNAPDDPDLDPAGDGEADVTVDMSDTDAEAPEGEGDGAPADDAPSVDADDLDDETVEAIEDMADAAGEGESSAEPQGDESQQAASGGAASDDEGEDTPEPADAATAPQDGSQADADEEGEGDAAQTPSPGGSTGGDSTAATGDDHDHLLDDMDRLDGDDHAAGDMMDLDDGDDYHEPDSGDETRYEQIQHAQAFAATDWAERMDARDEYPECEPGDLPSDEIQSLMRESGLADDLRRAFQRIKTAEVTETTAKPTSKLDVSNVVRHMAGDYGVRDVYQTTKTGASGGRTICAVMDASGSMDHSGSMGRSKGGTGCIVDAKVVLAALHLAAHEIGDTVVATAFDTTAADDVRLVTGPDESFQFDHLDGFTGISGSTATGAGVLDGVRLLERAGGKDRVMVVITDGGANADLTGTRWSTMKTGDGAVPDARMAVETARDEGITVIGVGVGTGVSEWKLEDTFGPGSWIHVDADDLVDEVVRIYREQLDDDRVAEAL